MSLRARIAAVASLSVALAVLAAAIGLYVAVRSDLRGEIDHALRARARRPSRRPPVSRARHGDKRLSRRLVDTLPATGRRSRGMGTGFPGAVEPAPFGAASGYVQFISRQGSVFVPGGQGASPTRIAISAADRRSPRRAAARASPTAALKGRSCGC